MTWLGAYDGRCRGGRDPREAARVEPPCGAPNTEAVVHEQLDAGAAGVGEQIAVIGLRGAEDLNHASEQPIGSAAHVDRLGREPHRFDADHRRTSRTQAAHSLAEPTGHVTFRVVAPRCNSMWMSAAMGDAGVGIGNGKNLGVRVLAGLAFWVSLAALPSSISAPISDSLTHRRTRFALMPLAIATEADDTPGLQQAATICALNSAL